MTKNLSIPNGSNGILSSDAVPFIEDSGVGIMRFVQYWELTIGIFRQYFRFDIETDGQARCSPLPFAPAKI